MGRYLIETPLGKLEGLEENGVLRFLGVPYTAPPVGALRWKGPQPPLPFAGVRDCTVPSPMPVQALSPGHPLTSHPMSEDCLYLNIWAPADFTEKHAVHVWFYGGSLQNGCADSPDLDGSAYARDDVVAVNVSYRVGTLGFMCHPDMAGEDPEGMSGNFGHRDQIAALKWIRGNIALFGGDPDRITISGQSAGSGSCCTLMNAPSARGLFHRAICHSGDIFQPERDVALEDACAWGVELAKSFGCSSLEEFRKIPSEELYADGDPMFTRFRRFAACVIDPAFLPGTQGGLMLQNRCAQIPVIIGTNLDEGSRWKAEDYVPAITKRLGLPEDFYAGAERDLNAEATALAIDYWYGRHLAWAKIRTECYHLPTWEYVFARRLGPHGAFHGAEIPYTFGTIERMAELGSGLPYEPGDHTLSGLMHRYWVNFIKYGDPNGIGESTPRQGGNSAPSASDGKELPGGVLPAWPQKSAGGHMQFDLVSGMQGDVLTDSQETVLPRVEAWMRSRM